MILRPGYCYSFLRTDPIRYKKERDESIKYPYIGEILSDSWGDSKEPKERLLWDEDWNSGDFWQYEDIYPELLTFVSLSIYQGYSMSISESADDHTQKPNDYTITDRDELVMKLDDKSLSHLHEEDKKLIMSSPYGKFFAHLPNRPTVNVERITSLRGKPYFGDKEWKLDDVYLYCMIQLENNDLQMVSLSHRHIKDIETDYEYVKMVRQCPVFKLKELKDA